MFPISPNMNSRISIGGRTWSSVGDSKAQHLSVSEWFILRTIDFAQHQSGALCNVNRDILHQVTSLEGSYVCSCKWLSDKHVKSWEMHLCTLGYLWGSAIDPEGPGNNCKCYPSRECSLIKKLLCRGIGGVNRLMGMEWKTSNLRPFRWLQQSRWLQQKSTLKWR